MMPSFWAQTPGKGCLPFIDIGKAEREGDVGETRVMFSTGEIRDAY